jgi:hypothetical protein
MYITNSNKTIPALQSMIARNYIELISIGIVVGIITGFIVGILLGRIL